MGTRVSLDWMEHPEFIHDPAELRKTWRWCRRVSSKSDRKKALDADVIVTTSGMLEGGPVIWYLNRLRHDMSNGILLTGYQAEGTGGRLLLDEKKLRIFGNITPVELEVNQFSLSNHGGQAELSSFARGCAPRHVVIFHADEEGRDALSAEIGQEAKVHLPTNSQSIYLD